MASHGGAQGVVGTWRDHLQRRKRAEYMRRLVRMTTSRNRQAERVHAARVIQVGAVQRVVACGGMREVCTVGMRQVL